MSRMEHPDWSAGEEGCGAVGQEVQQLYSTAEARCLVTGPPESGKSSLLFRYAAEAAREGRTALIILTKKDHLEDSPPYLPPHLLTSDILSKISLRYLCSASEAKKYLTSIHLLSRQPDAILVDELADLVAQPYGPNQAPPVESKGRAEHDYVKVLALAVEAASLARDRTGRPCAVVVTDTMRTDVATARPGAATLGGMPQSSSLGYLSKRWLPQRLQLRPYWWTTP